jgi:transporter family-2 protein
VDRGVAVVLTAAVGGLVALQAPVNAVLGKAVGSFQSAFLNFVIGTIAIAAIVALARGGFGTLGDARSVPWYYLTGGLFGAAYVTTVLVTVKSLGAAPVTAATIAGQLTASVVLDQFGLLGLPKDPITVGKVVGILLLVAGVYLVVRE